MVFPVWGTYFLHAIVGLHLQITDTVTMPEIAFTGDTMSDFIVDDNNIDVLRAKVLIMEVQLIAVMGHLSAMKHRYF